MIKVSIILTTYNSKDNFVNTIDSVLSQDYKNIEIIIKDGVSVDGTIEAIKSYEAQYPELIKWESSIDSGIYNAMNRGIALASGDVILVFNDMFVTNTAISRVVSIFESDDKCMGVHSDLVFVQDGKVVRTWKMGSGKFSQGWMPAHPTLFLRKEVYRDNGVYNESYRCAADYEFMIRAFSEKEDTLRYIPDILVEMAYGGESTNGIKGYMISLKESYRALRENNQSCAWYIELKRILIVVKQFLIK